MLILTTTIIDTIGSNPTTVAAIATFDTVLVIITMVDIWLAVRWMLLVERPLGLAVLVVAMPASWCSATPFANCGQLGIGLGGFLERCRLLGWPRFVVITWSLSGLLTVMALSLDGTAGGQLAVRCVVGCL